MQIHATIDDQLFFQATHLTGMTDERLLLEYALEFLIQTKKIHKPTPASVMEGKFGFWNQLQHFRSTINLAQFSNIDETIADVRDKNPGRSIRVR